MEKRGILMEETAVEIVKDPEKEKIRLSVRLNI
jgi:hypothetical protein